MPEPASFQPGGIMPEPKAFQEPAEPEAGDTAALQEADLSDALSQLLGALGSDAERTGKTVNVYLFRLLPGGEQEFLSRQPPEAFDLAEVKSNYGGGKYLARIKVGSKWAKGVTFHVAGRPKEPPEAPPPPSPLPAPPEPAPAALAALAAEFRAIVEELRRPPARAHDQDPATLALSIVGAVQSAVRPYQDALLAQGTKSGGGSAKDLMDVFLQGLEMGRDQANPPESFTALARDLVSPLLKALPPQAGTPPMPGALPPADNLAPMRPGWAVWLAPYVPTLIRWASAGKDPAGRADLILDEIPPGVLPAFIDLIADAPRFTAELCIHFPELRPYRPWVEAVALAMRDSFEWEITTDGDEIPEADAGAHEEP